MPSRPTLSFTNPLIIETELIISVFLLIWIRPSMPAVISDITNAVCLYNCHHHGECHYSSSRHIVSCACHIGWGGDACDIPCERHCGYGRCVFAGSKQLCICSLGYRGEMCTESGYDMESLLTMAKLISASTAQVMPLVEDPRAEIQASIQRSSSACTSNFVCQHGGRCVNGEMGGYRCQCDPSRFTGIFCQYTCPKSCLNGGSCVRLRKTGSRANTLDLISLPESRAVYRCACPEGFSGERCDSRVRTIFSVNTSLGT